MEGVGVVVVGGLYLYQVRKNTKCRLDLEGERKCFLMQLDKVLNFGLNIIKFHWRVEGKDRGRKKGKESNEI